MPRPAKQHPVDIHVGKQLQARRTLCGLSQAELADRLDITFQQLQKYETGNNRMAAGRLWQASKVLGVPVEYFFEGLDGKADPASGVLATRAGLELVRDFEACSERIRNIARQMATAVAEEAKPRGRRKAK